MTFPMAKILFDKEQSAGATSICEQNIRQFLARHIHQWAGLPANCKKSDITAIFPFNDGEGVAYFGTNNVKYQFRALSSERFSEEVFFYFLSIQLSHIATEYWSFDQRECADILRSLGKPMHRLDFFWKQRAIAGGELLYPDKGIAIGVIPETGLIALVTVFCPCTEDVYKESYWNTRHAREF